MKPISNITGFTPGYEANPTFAMSDPIFNFDPYYESSYYPLIPDCTFDSNFYFNSFGLLDTLPSLPPTLPQSLPVIPTYSSFEMPEFNLSNFLFPTLTLRQPAANNTLRRNYSIETSVKFQSLSAAGYNKQLAEALTRDALAHKQPHSTGYCARYVSNAMKRLGVVGKRGHAYELRDNLRKNPHFREIDINTVDIKKLPAGCILVYQRGAAGYSSKYGHVEITVGDGTAVSDFLNHHIKKTPNMNIFVPVSA